MNRNILWEGVQERRGKNPIGDIMIIPVRCFSCGKVIGSLYEAYKQKIEQGEPPKEVMDELGITRYCCRQLFVSHVDLIDEVMEYD